MYYLPQKQCWVVVCSLSYNLSLIILLTSIIVQRSLPEFKDVWYQLGRFNVYMNLWIPKKQCYKWVMPFSSIFNHIKNIEGIALSIITEAIFSARFYIIVSKLKLNFSITHSRVGFTVYKRSSQISNVKTIFNKLCQSL